METRGSTGAPAAFNKRRIKRPDWKKICCREALKKIHNRAPYPPFEMSGTFPSAPSSTPVAPVSNWLLPLLYVADLDCLCQGGDWIAGGDEFLRHIARVAGLHDGLHDRPVV